MRVSGPPIWVGAVFKAGSHSRSAELMLRDELGFLRNTRDHANADITQV